MLIIKKTKVPEYKIRLNQSSLVLDDQHGRKIIFKTLGMKHQEFVIQMPGPLKFLINESSTIPYQNHQIHFFMLILPF